jgi:Ca2+-binding EF-hand superfamily protein
MQKVGKEDFDELLKLFEELDENNNGYLDYDDLSEKYKQHKSRAPIAFQNVL